MKIPEDWWYLAFEQVPTASEARGHPKGDPRMLIIVAYDITEPKRWKKIANTCLDYGVRVQLSVFECRLEADRFKQFWEKICAIADPEEDKLVAYPISGAQAREVRTFGAMVCSKTEIAYIF